MFKWFRKYNKVLLVGGGCFLMIAFLVPQSISMVGQGRANPTIGTVDGEEIQLSQQQQAAYDLDLIRRVFGAVHPMLAQIVEDDPHRWLLMKLDARRMGLSAGDPEVASLLAAIKVDPEENLDEYARRLTIQYEITEDYLYAALADWLTIEKYKELVRGQTHVPVRDRLIQYVQLFAQINQTLEQAPQQMRGFYMQQFFMPQLIRTALSEPRVSKPLLERFAADTQSQVTIAAVPVSADLYLSRVDEPTDERLTELFEKYKDDLPGEGEPYAIGYKYPDRAKIEYLSIPLDRVADSISIEEAEAVRYYDQNQDRYTHTPEAPEGETEEGEETTPPTPVVKPYKDVRSEIIDTLRTRQAEEKVATMIRAAQTMLLDDAATLDQREGYREIPDDWSPISLDDVAQRIQKRFEILPDVTRIDDRWLDRAALSELDGIGSAMLEGRQRASFPDYVLSARAFKADETDPLLTLKLQQQMPSLPLADFEGSRYLFRVIDASPTHVPESLDEVREKVVEDAKRIAAYQLLLDDKTNWSKRIESETLEQLAESLEVKIISSQPFPRRRGTEAPSISQVGQDADFVDAVFEVADTVAAQDAPIEQIPAADRTATAPGIRTLTLYLVRIDAYEPLTPSQLTQQLQDPKGGLDVYMQMLDEDATDPLSTEAITARLGYKPTEEGRTRNPEDEEG